MKHPGFRGIPPITIILLFLITTGFGQEHLARRGSDLLQVISTNGLYMRQSPDLGSSIICGIPFGAIVKIDTSHIFVSDTLGSYETYVWADSLVTKHLAGHWIKTAYNGNSGFVFSSFLREYYSEYTKKDPHPVLNKDYVLQFPSCTCQDNFHFISKMNWFGLYSTDEESFEMKEVNLRYFMNPENYMFPDCISTEQTTKNLKFIIGSKERHLRIRTGGTLHPYWDESFNSNHPIHSEFSYDKESSQLSLWRDGKTQVMNPPGEISVIGVLWKGDLDGDNQDDYIIQFGVKSTEVFLYLTSESERSQIVKPVAVYYDGYCC